MNLENIAASLGFKSADASSKAFERHVGVRHPHPSRSMQDVGEEISGGGRPKSLRGPKELPHREDVDLALRKMRVDQAPSARTTGPNEYQTAFAT